MITENALTARHRFTDDSHRPKYHYLPPANWMNDPNGVIQWNGRYHLFYQYNPDGAYHANMHWGHAVSDDLVFWEDLPIAMAPTPLSVDEGGIFSGCVVNHNGTAKMFYTGVNPGHSIQTQCLAIGDAELVTWEKHAANPLIAAPPATMGQTNDFRDPFVWQEDDAWYMVVGSRIEGVGGAVLLYRSADLIHWEYLNPLLIGEVARSGVMWECPNFFRLGDQWVLIISAHIGHTTGTVLYYIGQYENHRFTPEHEGVLDPGYYYAPLTHLDQQNRRLMFGWVREGRTPDHQRAAGWSGVQALPRVLSLDAKDRLIMQVVPEVARIRGKHHTFRRDDITEKLLPVQGRHLEMHVVFDASKTPECGIVVAASPDGEEQTTITYNVDLQVLRIHRQTASPLDGVDSYVQGALHTLDEDHMLRLHILLDASVLEVIANERASLTSRVYTQRTDSLHLMIVEPSSLVQIDLWEMSSIW